MRPATRPSTGRGDSAGDHQGSYSISSSRQSRSKCWAPPAATCLDSRMPQLCRARLGGAFASRDRLPGRPPLLVIPCSHRRHRVCLFFWLLFSVFSSAALLRESASPDFSTNLIYFAEAPASSGPSHHPLGSGSRPPMCGVLSTRVGACKLLERLPTNAWPASWARVLQACDRRRAAACFIEMLHRSAAKHGRQPLYAAMLLPGSHTWGSPDVGQL